MKRGSLRRVAILAHGGDAPGHVGRLRDRLVARYGPDRVAILDETSAPSALGAGSTRPFAAFLVVLGQRWPSNGGGGEDSLTDAAVVALAGGRPVLPVLVGGRPLPSPAELPEPLRQLGRLNIVELADESWSADLRARVLPFLDKNLGGRPRRLARQPAAVAALVACVAGGSILGWWAISGPGPVSPLAPITPYADAGFTAFTTACYTLLIPRASSNSDENPPQPGNDCQIFNAVGELSGVSVRVGEYTYPTPASYPRHPQSLATQTKKAVSSAKVERRQRLEVGGFPAEEIFVRPFAGYAYEVYVVVAPKRPFFFEDGQVEGFLFEIEGPARSLPVISHIIDNITFNQSDLP